MLTQARAYRDTGHGLAGVPVNGRTLAAARLAHKLATRPTATTATPWGYLDSSNAARALDPATGWQARLVAAFRL